MFVSNTSFVTKIANRIYYSVRFKSSRFFSAYSTKCNKSRTCIRVVRTRGYFTFKCATTLISVLHKYVVFLINMYRVSYVYLSRLLVILRKYLLRWRPGHLSRNVSGCFVTLAVIVYKINRTGVSPFDLDGFRLEVHGAGVAEILTPNEKVCIYFVWVLAEGIQSK